MNSSRFQLAPPLSPWVRQRRVVVSAALSALGGWGYEEIEVPLLAPWSELRSAIGETIANQLFRFVDRDGTLLVLRGDMTPVVARQMAPIAATRATPVRVCYANRVARIHRAFAREQVESYELGMELIQVPGAAAELETLCVAADVFRAVGLDAWEVRVGDVRIVAGLVAATGADGADRLALERAIGHRDRWEVHRLATRLDVAAPVAEALQTICRPSGSTEALSSLVACAVPDVVQASMRLARLVAQLDALGHGGRTGIDLTATDDRGYYTGTRFTFLSGRSGEVLGGGGRYDRLYAHFGPDLPAVGFGLRVDRLVACLESGRGAAEADAVLVEAAGDPVASIRVALQARAFGQRVELVHGAGGEDDDA